MRRNLLHPGYMELSYEIREIVEVAKNIEKYGIKIIWENIGDPIVKGEKIPDWVKTIIQEAIIKDEVYAYSPTKGLEKTREYLANKTQKTNKEDIIFFNGLGEAINKIYGYLSPGVKVIGPNPAYPSHSSAEATNSGSSHITYTLDPFNDWNPNLEEIENKVKYNPNISAILVINPDNPTGAVFKKDVLEKIVDIAKRYDLFLIFDEIYEKLVYDEQDKVMLRDIIGDVPGISMQGMSKALPWPGARCGWIEIYNRDHDENFSKYINSILMSKMLEVCSTTLPQYVLPDIYENKDFYGYIKERVEKYKQRADIAQNIFSKMCKIRVIKPKGAFYLSIMFNLDKFDLSFEPKIDDYNLDSYIKSKTSNIRFDKKFCYYMLAETGICSVPLSGFNSTFDGFRITLLEEDIEKFKSIIQTITDFINNWGK